jgi:hypothetical protein
MHRERMNILFFFMLKAADFEFYQYLVLHDEVFQLSIEDYSRDDISIYKILRN